MGTPDILQVVQGDIRYNTFSAIIIEHLPEEALTVGEIVWPEVQPVHTYTIDATPALSLELDTKFPVRPSGVRLLAPYDVVTEDMLERLLGEEAATAMQQAARIGGTILSFALGASERLAIAGLQVRSPSTPPLIRRACRLLLASNGAAQAA